MSKKAKKSIDTARNDAKTLACIPQSNQSNLAKSPSPFAKRLLLRCLYTTVLVGITCFVHMFLQSLYYSQCRSSIWRVVMYNESDACRYMGAIVHMIEASYVTSFRCLSSGFLNHSFGHLSNVLRLANIVRF